MRISKLRVRAADVASAGLFSRVPTSAVENLIATASVCCFSRGEAALKQGERSGAVHVIVSGAFKASSLGTYGNAVTHAVMGKDEVFGEMAFLDGGEHSANVSAMTTSCTLRISHSTLAGLVETHPSVGDYLAKVLATRLRRLSKTSESMASETMSVRLARQLLDLTERFGTPEGESTRIGVELPQRELAELVGATRERVNRTLAQWIKDGSIALQGQHIVVRSKGDLTHHAGLGEAQPHPKHIVRTPSLAARG